MSTHKATAVSFLDLASTGKVKEAYAHTTQGFRHHNPHFPGDKQSLMDGMQDNAAHFPDKHLEVKHTIEEGDLVAVHSHVRHTHDEAGYGLVHIFRFEDRQIAELWDLAQEVPKDSPNANGMF